MKSRREFLELGLAAAGVGALIPGCGGGGSSDDGGAGSCTPSSSISDNHGHVLMVPRADIMAPTSDKTYSIEGSAGHDHQVTLTAAMLTALAGGTSAMMESTNSNGHTHFVTVMCV